MHLFIYFQTVFTLKQLSGVQEEHVFASCAVITSLQLVHRAIEEVSGRWSRSAEESQE